MFSRRTLFLLWAPALVAAVLLEWHNSRAARPAAGDPDAFVGPGDSIQLPAPFATSSARATARITGWPSGTKPVAPAGFQVSLFAAGLQNPRWVYVLPNQDVLVAETRGDGSIVLFRDRDGDGTPELRATFLEHLNQPFGMLLLGDSFYVANTDAVLRYRYTPGETRITSPGEKLLDLPTGGHSTRNITASPDGKKLYVSVGSRSNVDENGSDARDPRRAAVLEMNPDGSGMRVFASGLRNPVGLDWEPATKTLWTVVNERDGLGDDLVPDYLTQVREGAFYGWPYSYFGQHVDPRKQGERPDLVAKATIPDYSLGSHVAPLGLAFYTGRQFPQRYRGGAFIGEHGSWNRSQLVGYKVVFLPFNNGKPSGKPEDFLTGFLYGNRETHGRPVGVAVAADGSLLVVDDGDDKVWRVHYAGR